MLLVGKEEKKNGGHRRFHYRRDRAGGGGDDHGAGGRGARRKAARIRGTRAAADETNSDVIDDCSVDRKRDNCRSDVARQRKAIRV